MKSACFIVAVLALILLVAGLALLGLNLNSGRSALAAINLACVVINAAIFAINVRMALS